MARSSTPHLPFSPVRNSELFANHWLEHRLPSEPEFTEQSAAAVACLDALAKLWDDKKPILTPALGEHGMEDEWVHPVLDALGWPYAYQTNIQGRKPDYALFLTPEDKRTALKVGKNHPDFWKSARIVADAKAWDIRLDRPIGKGASREYPPEQIEWYLNRTLLDWGILTNGRLWRLIPRQLQRNQPRFETYLEIDLPETIRRWQSVGTRGSSHTKEGVRDDFLRWYLLATPIAFQTPEGRAPLIQRALKGSTEYRTGVGSALRNQVFKALSLCIEGFLSHKPNNLDPVADMAACRANAFTLLFRLLFILFAEDRKLLPHGKNSLYTGSCSLTKQHTDLLNQPLPSNQTNVWKDWQALFAIIDGGKASFGVPAYNGGLFDSDAHPFLTKHALPDTYAYRVLDELRRAPEDPDDKKSERVRVDYRDLAIQHLGNIYEGLLELHPRHAPVPMIVIAGREDGKVIEKTVPASDEVPKGFQPTTEKYARGQVYLETDKGERRASGSYYTPDHIVAYIVENTLRPLCDEVEAQLKSEIAAVEAARKGTKNGKREAYDKDLARLQADYDDRILRLAVLDPAMGSGHFLLRACQFLAEQIATNPLADDPDAPADNAGDAPTLLYWKRRVVERCIYGVDLNPIAVELAKLALWLETVSADQPLSFLDHHLRCGDSLIGARIDSLGRLYDRKTPVTEGLWSTIEHYTTALLKPLDAIRNTPSLTVDQVKAKEKLYRKIFEPIRAPFKKLADLWTADFFAPTDRRLTAPRYAQARDAASSVMKFQALEAEPDIAAALQPIPGLAPFHWELEFPEVFLSPERRQAGRTGFDAIIGNPPYDVLAEKELGRDLSKFKAFVEAMAVYEPSRRGKNNLYKLFICRALDLLADGGRMGFIVPMALLGDDQAAGIRGSILKVGTFTSVDAFPQKDVPSARVFPEAKLSTAVFGVFKSSEAIKREGTFAARQHPADQIDPASPAVTMSTADIPKYDPENLSIVSCSQRDWDLAVRLMTSHRMVRLGELAQFSQGEINETVQRAAGHLANRPEDGQLVQRGANVSLYILRPASQGEDIYLRVSSFLQGKGKDTKAHHHKHARVALQESCPQNNFRRLIASLVPTGEYCNHKINYVPAPASKVPLEVLLAVLNSQLADWYFRLGSTNAAVSHYQLHNLPFPAFATDSAAGDVKRRDAALSAIKSNHLDAAFDALRPLLAKPPFSAAIQDVLVDLVKRIIRAEKARGPISRSARSALSPEAQPYQDLIDRIIYALAGLTDEEARGLEARLATML